MKWLLLKAASFTADHSMIDVLIELKSERSRRQPITLSQDDDKAEVFYDPALDYVKHIEVILGEVINGILFSWLTMISTFRFSYAL